VRRIASGHLCAGNDQIVTTNFIQREVVPLSLRPAPKGARLFGTPGDPLLASRALRDRGLTNERVSTLKLKKTLFALSVIGLAGLSSLAGSVPGFAHHPMTGAGRSW
jgi:hypothetical protein